MGNVLLFLQFTYRSSHEIELLAKPWAFALLSTTQDETTSRRYYSLKTLFLKTEPRPRKNIPKAQPGSRH